MGFRRLMVDPEMLVDMLKTPKGVRFSYSVLNPLPADTSIAAVDFDGADLALVLESAEWDGGTRNQPLLASTVGVKAHYTSGDCDEEQRRLASNGQLWQDMDGFQGPRWSMQKNVVTGETRLVPTIDAEGVRGER